MSDFTPCTTPKERYFEGFAAGLTIGDPKRPHAVRRRIRADYYNQMIPAEIANGLDDGIVVAAHARQKKQASA